MMTVGPIIAEDNSLADDDRIIAEDNSPADVDRIIAEDNSPVVCGR